MAQSIPTLNSRGRFSLKTPWEPVQDTEYTVTGISDIATLLEQEQDIRNDVYLANGLTDADYESALQNDVVIVTLSSNTAQTIQVPSDFILSTPDLNTVAYSNILLSINLGPLPSSISLEHLKTHLLAEVLDVIGVDARIREHISPSSGAVLFSQHLSLEQQRSDKVTVQVTDRARRIQAEQRSTALQERVALLEQLVIDQRTLIEDQASQIEYFESQPQE